jgi:hypothetical protein
MRLPLVVDGCVGAIAPHDPALPVAAIAAIAEEMSSRCALVTADPSTKAPES